MSLLSVCVSLLIVVALCTTASPARAGTVPQQLQKGATFRMTVNAEKVVRPANHRVLGISFFQLWDYLPIYDRNSGQWVLRDSATRAIQSLQLPFGRLYWLDRNRRGMPAWDLYGSIDRAHELCQRLGIPEDEFVLELEAQQSARALSPQAYAKAVRYSLSKGYKFRLWEVCNEPYGMGNADDDPWTREGYVAHVKAVYPAIKAAQPEAKVGISAGLNPFNAFGATQTYDPVIAGAAGYYDFIAPHFYCHLKDLDRIPFEQITLGGNAWVLNSYVVKTRELLSKYNPGRHIDILDTEWGMHGYDHGEDSRADDANRNGNIAGALHRAIRMIYYLNDGLVEAAGQWCILSPANRPGFAIVNIDDDREFLLYYLNYYFGRYVGDEVVDLSGTCPYYEQRRVANDYAWDGLASYDVSMPDAPSLATKSQDGKHLYLIVANGTAAKHLPCRVEVKGFPLGTAEGKQLTQASIDAPALVEKQSDVVHALPVKIVDDGAAIEFESAAHSVSFLALTRRK